MVYYSLKAIKESLPKEKNGNDSMWVRFVVRRVSFFVTYLLINIGASASSVSLFSVLVAFAATFLFFINGDLFRWIGVILIHLWMILDCVDGNIARVKKTASTMGEFVDAQSGYVISAFCYMGFAMSAYYTTGYEKYAVCLIVLGAIASISNVLSRLIHQKYQVSIMKNSKSDNSVEKSPESISFFSRLRKRLGKELGLSGAFMIITIPCQIFKLYDFVTVFYFLFCTASLFAVLFYYSIKSIKEQ